MLPFIATLGLAAAVGSDGAEPRKGLTKTFSKWYYDWESMTMSGFCRIENDYIDVWQGKPSGRGTRTSPGWDAPEFLMLAGIFNRAHGTSMDVVPRPTVDEDTGEVHRFHPRPMPSGLFRFVEMLYGKDSEFAHLYELRCIPPDEALEALLGEPVSDGFTAAEFWVGPASESETRESIEMIIEQMEKEGVDVHPNILKEYMYDE